MIVMKKGQLVKISVKIVQKTCIGALTDVVVVVVVVVEVPPPEAVLVVVVVVVVVVPPPEAVPEPAEVEGKHRGLHVTLAC